MELNYKELAIRSLASGHRLSLPVFRFGQAKQSPHVYMQANVHGSEVQGILVLYHLIDYLKKLPASALRGRITVVPCANPYALNTKIAEYTVGPFDIMTGANWNRGYWCAACRDETERNHPAQINIQNFVRQYGSKPWVEIKSAFQQQLNTQLKKYHQGFDKNNLRFIDKHSLALQALALDADYVLDLHTAAMATRFAYIPAYALAAASYLHNPFFLEMGTVCGGALDEAYNYPRQLLLEALANKPQSALVPHAITLELGSQEKISQSAALEEAKGILNYLKAVGVLSGKAQKIIKTQYVAAAEDFLAVCAPQGGLMEYEVQPGQNVKKNAVLGWLLQLNKHSSVSQRQAIRAPYAGIVLSHYPSAVVHEGVELYKLMTKIRLTK